MTRLGQLVLVVTIMRSNPNDTVVVMNNGRYRSKVSDIERVNANDGEGCDNDVDSKNVIRQKRMNMK